MANYNLLFVKGKEDSIQKAAEEIETALEYLSESRNTETFRTKFVCRIYKSGSSWVWVSNSSLQYHAR
jgi:hypothetical protein